MHSDHVGQFGMLVQSLWLRTRRAPLHVFGPPQVVRVMKEWLERCLLFPELIGFPIEWHPVEPGVPVSYGSFELTAFPTEHLASLASQFRAAYPTTCFTCYGVAIDCHGRRYVYSADLAHPNELAPALENHEVTALICELSHFPERELFQELARHDVKSVWLTHYPDSYVGEEKKLRITAQEQNYTRDRPFVAGQGCGRDLSRSKLHGPNPLTLMANDLSKPSLPIFSWIGHLKDDDRELLSSYGEFFPGHPGTVIIEEGACRRPKSSSSSAASCRSTLCRRTAWRGLLAEVGPGETLGEISLFTPGAADGHGHRDRVHPALAHQGFRFAAVHD